MTKNVAQPKQKENVAEDVVLCWMDNLSPLIKSEVIKFITMIAAIDWGKESSWKK